MKNILLVLFLFYASFTFGQSYHTISIGTDTTDWNDAERVNSSWADAQWGMTWDVEKLYFMFSYPDSIANGDYAVIYIDTDPNGANGSTVGNYSGVTEVNLPFKADYEFLVRLNSNFDYLRYYNGSQWNYVDDDSNGIDATGLVNYMELYVPWTVIGSPTQLKVTMFVGDASNFDNGFAFAPAGSSTASKSSPANLEGLNITKWFAESNLGSGVDPLNIEDDPLPVELKSFSASVDGKNVNLAWQTATEVNNYGFEVERLTVNGKWEKLGFVAGKGNTNAAQNYKFADNNVSGKVSYRLKQIDIDGKFEYSEVVAVEVIANEFALEQNFPNPFNPSTVINYSLAKEAFVKLAVYNAIGQEVVTLINGVQSVGAHKVTFNASSFNSGVYFYRIETADFTAMRKMLLVK